MKTLLLTATTLVALLGSAAAQTTPTQPPPTQPIPGSSGPTLVQCNQGYTQGMPWTQAEFTAACAKLKESDKGR